MMLRVLNTTNLNSYDYYKLHYFVFSVVYMCVHAHTRVQSVCTCMYVSRLSCPMGISLGDYLGY